ncbi:MAG: carboxypeptidase-like regulatory domain-containing protein [Blastocatellia bacterium]
MSDLNEIKTRKRALVFAMQTLFLLLFSGVICHGQSAGGTLAGIVRDGSGAVLPGAIIRLTNGQSQQSLQTTTDADGAFRFPGLPPGRYQVETTLTGFARNVL